MYLLKNTKQIKVQYILLRKIWIVCLIFFLSCEDKKQETPEEEYKPLVFNSLTAEQTTIEPGATTSITADASGFKIVYLWSATAGDIIGSGSEIVYVATPCATGKNTVTCTVRDGKGETETREIIINVI